MVKKELTPIAGQVAVKGAATQVAHSLQELRGDDGDDEADSTVLMKACVQSL